MKSKSVPKSQSYLWIALTIALLFVVLVQLPGLLDPFAIEEDFRNLEYLRRQSDPNLFPTAEFEGLGVTDIQLGSRTVVIDTNSPGFSFLYQIATNFVSLVFFSKLLAIPLLLLSVFYIYRIGEKLGDKGTALALSIAFTIFILASTSEISILSGLQRAFAIPFTLGLIYYLMEKRYRFAALMLFLTGAFYLPSFPVALMTYGLCLINYHKDGKLKLTIQWRPLIELIFVVLIFLFTISPTIIAQFGRVQEGVDSANQEEQRLLDNPEFQSGGRKPLFIITPFIGRAGLTTSAQDGFHLMLLFVFTLMILYIRRSNTTRPPPVLMNMLYASFLGFFLAWSSIFLTNSFLLYLPSRHTRVGLFLFLLIFVVINIQETLRVAVGWVMERRQQLIWYLLPLLVVVMGLALLLPNSEESDQLDFRGPFVSGLLIGLTMLLFVLAILVKRRRQQETTSANENTVALPSRVNWIILGSVLFIGSIFYVGFMFNELYSPEEEVVELFEFVETLPVDVILAGSPCVLDGVPFYGKRMVLFSCERYLSDQQMILDELRAYYAVDGEQIYTFCREYGVTHLVVDTDTLRPDYVAEGDYFFEPFNSTLKPELKNRTDFALNHVPEAQKLFQSDSIFVVSCNSNLIDISADG